MKAFVPAAALAIAAVIMPCVMALPAGDDIAAIERRQWWSTPAPTISASGANGGWNYYGNGAQGGSISIQKPTATPAPNINVNGANGGFNYGLGSGGANGGRISVGRREEHQSPNNYQYPNYYQYSNNYPIASLSGANGGSAYTANGGNGGTVTAHQPSTPTNIYLAGANGGLDVGGSTGGANGGTLSLNRRNKEQYPGSVSVTGANGGTNFYGNGANGGGISVNPYGYIRKSTHLLTALTALSWLGQRLKPLGRLGMRQAGTNSSL